MKGCVGGVSRGVSHPEAACATSRGPEGRIWRLLEGAGPGPAAMACYIQHTIWHATYSGIGCGPVVGQGALPPALPPYPTGAGPAPGVLGVLYPTDRRGSVSTTRGRPLAPTPQPGGGRGGGGPAPLGVDFAGNARDAVHGAYLYFTTPGSNVQCKNSPPCPCFQGRGNRAYQHAVGAGAGLTGPGSEPGTRPPVCGRRAGGSGVHVRLGLPPMPCPCHFQTPSCLFEGLSSNESVMDMASLLYNLVDELVLRPLGA